MMRYIKAMLAFARYQEWVEQPEWTKEDGVALTRFLGSNTGLKLKASLLNGVLRQQNNACTSENNVDRSIGYANGFRGCASFIESLAAAGVDNQDSE